VGFTLEEHITQDSVLALGMGEGSENRSHLKASRPRGMGPKSGRAYFSDPFPCIKTRVIFFPPISDTAPNSEEEGTGP